MISKTTKKVIKVSLLIIVILLVIGIIGFSITSKQPKIEQNENNSTSISYEDKTTISGKGVLLLGVIFITVLIILFYAIRKSPDFYKVLTDEKTIAVSKKYAS